MPFRCRCGKTYEKADTFASHTSACALFHQRRASDTSALFKHHQQTSSKIPSTINTSITSILPILIQQEQERRIEQQKQQQQQSSSPSSPEAMMQGAFLPTGLSLQYALEGAARKRSMSYDDNAKSSP